jgi:derlin-1
MRTNEFSNDLATWYHSIPLFTKYWFTADVVFPLAARMGLINAYNLFFIPKLVWRNFHIWRPFTALAYFPTSWNYLVNLYYLYKYSVRLEREEFSRKPADMAFMLLILFATSIIMGIIMGLYVLFELPIMAVVYIWCQLNKDVIVQFFFGAEFKAQYLPWVLCAFNHIVVGSGLPDLLGIFVGHVYYFLKFRYAQDFGGPDLLRTPQWLINYFPGMYGYRGFGAPPRSGGGGGQGGVFSGRGRRLGD